jgi:hypothetical protein
VLENADEFEVNTVAKFDVVETSARTVPLLSPVEIVASMTAVRKEAVVVKEVMVGVDPMVRKEFDAPAVVPSRLVAIARA